MLDLRRWAPSLTAYSKWVSAENARVAGDWSSRLNSSKPEQVEGAVAEACVWDYFGCLCDRTRLAELPGQGGLDFEFEVGDRRFLVEVTNIAIDAASSRSAMADSPPHRGSYALLTRGVWWKVANKAKQAERQDQIPLLVAVTTLHWNASRACINRRAIEFAMGSTPSITGKFNPATGAIEGDLYPSTDLAHSVFIAPPSLLGPDGAPIVQARFPFISGIMLIGFGLNPKQVRAFGGLNPEATRPLESSLLPDIPFCSFREWPLKEHLGFRWTITEDQERDREARAAEDRLRTAGHGALVDAIREEVARRSH